MRSAMLVPDAESFSFLLHANAQTVMPVSKSIIPTQHLTEGIRLLLSSYTKGIQKQRGFKGNLFQQKQRRNPLMMMVYLIR